MIALLSSAKTLDFTTPWASPATTQPAFLREAGALVAQLRARSASELATLMAVSGRIAQLNAERFRAFSLAHSADNAKPAILAYQGDVYAAMGSVSFSRAELAFSQATLRIVSGLYGLLRPLDLIQPYRLEMAVKLDGPGWKDLYGFWTEKITEQLSADCARAGGVLVNLASQEYAKAADPARLRAQVLTVAFKQERKGRLTAIGILAKRARGLMARHIIANRLRRPEGLRSFSAGGYRFSPELSSDSEWVFVQKA